MSKAAKATRIDYKFTLIVYKRQQRAPEQHSRTVPTNSVSWQILRHSINYIPPRHRH